MSPREIGTHKVNGLNESIYISTMDDRGDGGANYVYEVAPLTDVAVPRHAAKSGVARRRVPVKGASVVLRFQNGPIAEVGVNGISNEALLAVVRDRLEGFQSGPFACDTNQLALTHVKLAMDALHARTKDRLARGVEGTHQP